MKFIGRALTGLLLISITLALIGTGLWRLQAARPDNGGRQSQQAQERTFGVDVATLTAGTVVPSISAYGQIQAARMLEIRAAQPGVIEKLDPGFRDGMSVVQGQFLYQLDPEDFERQLSDAQLALEQARANVLEAKESLPLTKADVSNARRQYNLRRADLRRQSGLKGKGFVAQGSLDQARIAVTSAEQALNTTRKALLAAESRVRATELLEKRARIVLANTTKALADTRYAAPFAGQLTDITANAGRRINNNEKLGVLIDRSSLEVSFSVSDEVFGRLLNSESSDTLLAQPITATLDLGSRSVVVKGVLDRAAATTDLVNGGRKLFARIESDAAAPINHGDFVSVRILEPALPNVASIATNAVTTDGRILLLNDDSRLESHQATILRWQDDSVIVTDVPFGREYVTGRQPFLADGVKVRAIRSGEKPPPSTIQLSDQRRERIRRFIDSRRQLPDEIRGRILKALERDRVPARMVERIEARMKLVPAPGSS